ncbi:unnamed protein product [Amoebophrya sp. A25]|nr:unnamed protein product [Amoebophrya sp. A25]|eukprot:GSA25T00023801001.1
MAALLGKAMALQDAYNSEILPKVGRDDCEDTSREDTTVGYYGSLDYGKNTGAGRTTITTTTEKHSNLGYNKQAGQAAGEGAQDWKNPLVHRVICLVLLCFGLLFTLVGVERFLASSDNRAPKTRGKKGATAVAAINTKTDARQEAGDHSAHAALKSDDHHTQQDVVVGTSTKTKEKTISKSDHVDSSGVGTAVSGDHVDVVPGIGTAAVSGDRADVVPGVGTAASGDQHAVVVPGVGTAVSRDRTDPRGGTIATDQADRVPRDLTPSSAHIHRTATDGPEDEDQKLLLENSQELLLAGDNNINKNYNSKQKSGFGSSGDDARVGAGEQHQVVVASSESRTTLPGPVVEPPKIYGPAGDAPCITLDWMFRTIRQLPDNLGHDLPARPHDDDETPSVSEIPVMCYAWPAGPRGGTSAFLQHELDQKSALRPLGAGYASGRPVKTITRPPSGRGGGHGNAGYNSKAVAPAPAPAAPAPALPVQKAVANPSGYGRGYNSGRAPSVRAPAPSERGHPPPPSAPQGIPPSLPGQQLSPREIVQQQEIIDNHGHEVMQAKQRLSQALVASRHPLGLTEWSGGIADGVAYFPDWSWADGKNGRPHYDFSEESFPTLASSIAGKIYSEVPCPRFREHGHRDCVLKRIYYKSYTASGFITEAMLQHLLWTYFASIKQPGQAAAPNCVPFVDGIYMDPETLDAFIVMEAVEMLPSGKIYDGTPAGQQRAEEAYRCLKILNEEIGVTHGDVKQANMGIGQDGHLRLLDFGLATAWIENNKTPHPPILEIVAGAARENHWQTDKKKLVGGAPVYMHPHLLRIPSCVAQVPGAALPPTVGLHVDLYALAMSIVRDCFVHSVLGKKYGDVTQMALFATAALGINMALAEEPPVRVLDVRNDAAPAPEERPYSDCIQSLSRTPANESPPADAVEEYCSLQQTPREILRNSMFSTFTTQQGPLLHSEPPVCYNGFKRESIADLFEKPSVVSETSASGNQISDLVSSCLDFTATLSGPSAVHQNEDVDLEQHGQLEYHLRANSKAAAAPKKPTAIWNEESAFSARAAELIRPAPPSSPSSDQQVRQRLAAFEERPDQSGTTGIRMTMEKGQEIAKVVTQRTAAAAGATAGALLRFVRGLMG